VAGEALFLPRFAVDHPDLAAAVAGVGAADLDGLHARFGLRPDQVDMQQPVVEPGTLHLDPLCEHECPLELPCRDTAMQENAPLAVVILAASDHQLVVLLRDLQVIHGETGDRQRDPQSG